MHGEALIRRFYMGGRSLIHAAYAHRILPVIEMIGGAIDHVIGRKRGRGASFSGRHDYLVLLRDYTCHIERLMIGHSQPFPLSYRVVPVAPMVAKHRIVRQDYLTVLIGEHQEIGVIGAIEVLALRRALLMEAEATRMEIMNIETMGVTGGWLRFGTKSKRKDRWSAMGMGLYGARMIYDERTNAEDNSEPIIRFSVINNHRR